MEYVYAALLLHKLGKLVDESGITSIVKASGAVVDESKVKSLVASLNGLDIEAELANAIVASAAPAAGKPAEESAPVEEEKHEAAAEGLSALFG
ncbi:MAG: 50S ribosomal protein P1 [Candidatus Pacearchaeota archaeon]